MEHVLTKHVVLKFVVPQRRVDNSIGGAIDVEE